MHAPNVLVGSSLAKAFGAPLAVLTGSSELIARFREQSETRVHCSPPSAAVIQAARRALQINRREGERRRAWLRQLVGALRDQMARAGLRPCSELPFPVQSFLSRDRMSIAAVQRALLARGVHTLLVRACAALRTALTFIVTARHRMEDIDRAGRIAWAATSGSSITAPRGLLGVA
jgi:8-amino-7-oxononanoate synthase